MNRENPNYTFNMTSGVTVDEFQALEQKVLRAVEIVKSEREARATAEAEVARLRQQLAEQKQAAESNAESIQSQAEAAKREKDAAEGQIAALSEEREAVRQRVERMLHQIDELL